MKYNPPVCILTAGLGKRMGSEYNYINKSLLPFDTCAMISNIISNFSSNTDFIIALGHKRKQVIEYLEIAHPKINFIFINVKNYNKIGSGPAHSLNCCKKKLQKPFYFVACDTLFYPDKKINYKENYVGVSKINKSEKKEYCNFVIKDNLVINIKDKINTIESTLAFTGFLYVYDYKIFWKGINNLRTSSKEKQISSGLKLLIKESKLNILHGKWIDTGTKRKYKEAKNIETSYNFEKTNEFIYFVNNKVIKFYADKNIVKKRIKKTKINSKVFPNILNNSNQFYSYKYINGKTLYDYNNFKIFNNLIIWLDKNLWFDVKVDKNKFKKNCFNFYYTKTINRFNLFKKKYPKFNSPKTINGEKVFKINDILDRINWVKLSNGKPTFIHGDLQFDNIIYDKTNDKFTLIDWREDFDGNIKSGDMYYDLSKLMGGMILNYSLIKKNEFKLYDKNGHINIDFGTNFIHDSFIQKLNSFIISKNMDTDKVITIVSLIFLNMSPLHHPPFDKVLYYLSILQMTKLINKKNKFFLS